MMKKFKVLGVLCLFLIGAGMSGCRTIEAFVDDTSHVLTGKASDYGKK